MWCTTWASAQIRTLRHSIRICSEIALISLLFCQKSVGKWPPTRKLLWLHSSTWTFQMRMTPQIFKSSRTSYLKLILKSCKAVLRPQPHLTLLRRLDPLWCKKLNNTSSKTNKDLSRSSLKFNTMKIVTNLNNSKVRLRNKYRERLLQRLLQTMATMNQQLKE